MAPDAGRSLTAAPLAALLCLLGTAPAAAQEAPAPRAAAESLFAAGRFAEAVRAFEARWVGDSTDYQAALGLGTIALFGNRLDDARRWLDRAITLKPTEARPKALLGEALYRRDDFTRAAAQLRAAGRTLRATKLESFGNPAPNALDAAADSTRLPFVKPRGLAPGLDDLLPVVRGFVNGSDTLYFLIDTGGGELLLDSAVAAALGAVSYGQAPGVFAGGQAMVADGRVDSVRLGEFTLRRVPVRMMKLGHIAAALGGQRIDGVLGTVPLYHFLATIDYPRGALVLRRRTPAILAAFERGAAARGATVLPFWMAGDHFMFAWGRVNGRPPVLLFVDTGLAGGGFVCSAEAAREYGIDLSRAVSREGVGGAGPTRSDWVTVDSLSMGDVTVRDVRASVGAALRFRDSFGFDAGGIISHQFFRRHALTFDFQGMRLFLLGAAAGGS